MNELVRRYLKTGIFFLGTGLIIGLWMMWEREVKHAFASRYVLSAHTHAILVGFVMMMICGVALWMFPRPAKKDTRYDPRVAELAYYLLAVGTGARIVGELVHSRTDGVLLRWTVLIAGTLQVLGLGAFFSTMWTRIRTTRISE